MVWVFENQFNFRRCQCDMIEEGGEKYHKHLAALVPFLYERGIADFDKFVLHTLPSWLNWLFAFLPRTLIEIAVYLPRSSLDVVGKVTSKRM